MLEYDLNQPGVKPPYARKRRTPAARELVPVAEQQHSPSAIAPGELPSIPKPMPGEEGHGDDEGTIGPHQPPSSSSDPAPRAIAPENNDYWTMNESTVVRVHNRPRTKLFVPNEKDFPNTFSNTFYRS